MVQRLTGGSQVALATVDITCVAQAEQREMNSVSQKCKCKCLPSCCCWTSSLMGWNCHVASADREGSCEGEHWVSPTSVAKAAK